MPTAVWRSPWTTADNAAARPGEIKELGVSLRNPHPDPIEVTSALRSRQGGRRCADQRLDIEADSVIELSVSVQVPGRGAVEQRNAVRLAADVTGHPLSPAVPVALPGAQAWRVYRPATEAVDLDAIRARDVADADSWEELSVDANKLPLADLMADGGRGPAAALPGGRRAA